VRYSPKSALDAHWLSEAYDVLLDLSKMERSFSLAAHRAAGRRPVTRFDRSLLISQTPQKSNESTVYVVPFLEGSLRSMKEFMALLLQTKEHLDVSQ
jgi:fido (protein-threonine AMPylation protein)